MATKKETTSEKDTALALENIFDNFLKPGVVIREAEVVPGMKVKMRPLNIQEMALAFSVINSEQTPADVYGKVRAVSTLAQAIMAVNDVEITQDARGQLYQQLSRLPAVVVERLYEFYASLVEEQNHIYTQAGTDEAIEAVENF